MTVGMGASRWEGENGSGFPVGFPFNTYSFQPVEARHHHLRKKQRPREPQTAPRPRLETLPKGGQALPQRLLRLSEKPKNPAPGPPPVGPRNWNSAAARWGASGSDGLGSKAKPVWQGEVRALDTLLNVDPHGLGYMGLVPHGLKLL